MQHILPTPTRFGRQPDPAQTPSAFSKRVGGFGAGVLMLSAIGCAPVQDVTDSDQCPDVNYSVTELKDADEVGTNAAIDQAVLDRMVGKFPGCAVGIVDAGEIVYLKG